MPVLLKLNKLIKNCQLSGILINTEMIEEMLNISFMQFLKHMKPYRTEIRDPIMMNF